MAEKEQPEAVEVQALAKAPQGEIDTRALTPMELLSVATQQGASPELIAKYMDLQDRHEKKVAKQAFAQAFVRFKAMCPTIRRSGKGHYGPYATLKDIDEQVRPILQDCQLAYNWQTVEDNENWIKVKCCLKHTMEYSETNTLGGPPDRDGRRNELQARASTVWYLQRYTLKALLGIVDGDVREDDGSGGAASPPPPEPKSKVDPSLQEAAAAFTAACEKLTECVLARDVVKNLLGQVKNLVGQEQGATSAEDIAACTKWLLEQGRITDGVVIQVGHGSPLTQDELDAADEALENALNEDDNPGPGYAPDQLCVCSAGHKFRYKEIKVSGGIEVCPTCWLKPGIDNDAWHAI